MLVLARRAGEKIIIDERTTITVVKTQRGIVRLGFEGPALVRRAEIAYDPNRRRDRHDSDHLRHE